MTTEKTTPAAASNAAPQNAPAEDDFDAVFAEITSENADEKPAADAAAPAAAKPADAGADDAGAAPAATADAPADGAAAAPAAAEPTDAEKLAAAQARIAELEGAKPPVAETPKPTAETPAEETPAAEAPVQWYKPNEQEAEVLATFDKEWPEVSAALAVRNKVDMYNVVQYMFAQVAKSYGPKMERFEQVAEAVEEMATLNALRGAHNDYDTIHDKVVSWVEAMPVGFQKRAAQSVLTAGSTEEVTELIAEFKKANPQPLAAVPAAVAPAAKSKTELSAAAKKAANALSMVDSKRTAQTTAVDPNDFDGAWTEATGSSR